MASAASAVIAATMATVTTVLPVARVSGENPPEIAVPPAHALKEIVGTLRAVRATGPARQAARAKHQQKAARGHAARAAAAVGEILLRGAQQAAR